MNLLYLIAAYGPEYMAGEIHRELGQELVRLGAGFSVFTFESEGERRDRESQQPWAWADDGFPVYRSVTAGRLLLDLVNRAARPLLKYERFLPAEWALSRHLREHPEVDLVLAEGAYPFGAIAARACARHGVPYVVTVAGGDYIASPETEYGYGRFRLPRHLVRQVLIRADAIRATTRLVRDNVAALGGDPGKTFVVPRNVARALFSPPFPPTEPYRASARAEAARKWGPRPGPLLVCAGRLLPIKGFADAIRALPRLRPEFPALRLLVAGPDREGHRDELGRLAAELGVNDAVFFPGALATEDLRQALAAAHLVLVPSMLEGMNKVAVEAAALGTPVVVTRTTGIGESLAVAGAGVLVEPRDPAGLAEAAAALLRDPDRWAEMGRAGIAFAEGFHPRHISAGLLEICAWALDRAQVERRRRPVR